MADSNEDPAIREQHLDHIIAAYLEAERSGHASTAEELVGQHPDLAAELKSFFADRERFKRMAEPIPVVPISPPTMAETPARPGCETTAVHFGTNVRYFGDYELVEEIARGGMGVVYKAQQLSLNRIVAIKMILAGQLASEVDVQRFRAEAEAAANLDHPNIVPIYEVGEYVGQHYFSMKLIEGGSLAQQLVRFQKDLKAATKLLATVARSLHHAHQRGILHRDLKPANVLVDAQGQPYVTDFGLAKRVEGDARLTQSGAVVGTPSYMAPEQARGEKVLTTAVDIYSLGAILYELLTCRPPFQASTPLDTLVAAREQEPKRPRVLNPRVDRELETICLKCLEKNAARRYGSAEALAEDLHRWLAHEPIQARQSTAGQKLIKWVKRRPAVATLLAVVALVTVTALVLVTWQWQVALLARDAAKEGHDAAKLQLDRAERALYANRIALVNRELVSNNLVRAEEGLKDCQEDLRRWEWHYLRRVCDPGALFVYNVSLAHGVAFSPDGKLLASATDSWSVRISDAITGFKIHALPGCRSVAFSPNGKRLATVSSSHPLSAINVWDTTSGKEILTLRGHTKWVNSLTFSPDGQRLASVGGRDPKLVAGVSFSPDAGPAATKALRRLGFAAGSFRPTHTPAVA
jgi:tRNA A-37 threonylcarbamoyl transferase component Bud32